MSSEPETSDSTAESREGAPNGNASDPHVLESGKRTVIGFGDAGTPPDTDVPAWQQRVAEVIESNSSTTLAIDLASVGHMSSRLMASLLALRRKGVEIEIHNPSRDMVDLLSITAFGKQFRIVESNESA